ncbi:carbohydrate ABC transporter permease [Infirmifilum uzonense]|uniref:carbohydrate ABC transporter permease n=1 Tax=Infirmifilum uzonense TaxID=1550241 RepID=UPI00069AB015|nr:carbohydrate ABC transporter permease [Infirmifilum uzonense]
MRRAELLAAAILALFVALWLLPFWAVLMTSLKDDTEARLTLPVAPPTRPTLYPFFRAFDLMKQGLFNSLVFTVLATIFSTVIGSLNGYFLAKIRYSDILILLLSFGIFIPYHAVAIPLLIVTSRLGLYNSLLGLTLVHTAYGIPICTLFFTSFLSELPQSLIDAARVDGADETTIYTRVVLPVSWPAFVVTAVFQFTSIWNDFLFGLILTQGVNQPASVVLANLLGTTAAEWNTQMAGTFLYAFPVVLVYFLLGKYLVRGYLAGAIKA